MKISRSVFCPEPVATSGGFAYLSQVPEAYVQSCQTETIGSYHRSSCDMVHVTGFRTQTSSGASE